MRQRMFEDYEYENYYSEPERVTWLDVVSGISFFVLFGALIWMMCVASQIIN